MTWQAYAVVWRLKASLHAGRGKVGNLQLTRPYVTGRMLWGALTERLARLDAATTGRPATETEQYRQADAHKSLRFSYFFPALRENNHFDCQWPPEDESLFRYYFMDSYASTALDYEQQGALEGSLHEVEFLMPNTRPGGPTGESLPVYLMGVVLVQGGTSVPWQAAVARLQLGGERGYGWGWVEQARSPVPTSHLFGHVLGLEGDEPTVVLSSGKQLLAHTAIHGVEARGKVEPLVGREWGDGDEGRGAGQRVVFSGLCYAPGARVKHETTFRIGPFGIWEAVSDATP
jgi:hypothetical protein